MRNTSEKFYLGADERGHELEEQAMETKHKEITEKIIGAFFTVYNTLGYGLLEKVYENRTAI